MKLTAVLLLILVTHISLGQPYYLKKAPLSRYVSHNEAYNSPTAKARGIQNVPTEQQEKTVRYVAKYHIDPLREKVGGPLFIASFFRNSELNAAVKGSKFSDHLANNGVSGVDIDQDGHQSATVTNVELFHLIRTQVKFYKLIWEFGTTERPAWVHVSFSVDPMKNNNKVYRAVRLKNKTVYEIF